MATTSPTVHFGGPDLQQNILRDTLLRQINLTPSNGEILWVCYYLNDPLILSALLSAANKGVKITLIIEINSRTPEINQECIQELTHSKVNLVTAKKKLLWNYFGIKWHPHLHSKLYYFSHPKPRVFLGSYNPTSGIEYINEKLLQKIGDHSRSHNVLVEITDKSTVATLCNYIHEINRPWKRKFARLLPSHNMTHCSNQYEINFLPSLKNNPIDDLFSNKDSNATIKCAISHLKGPNILRPLKIAIKLKKTIDIVLEPSRRRVSKHHLSFLDLHNIKYYRPKLDNYCIMHNKFIIYKSDQAHCVMFGSFNWSSRSRLLNHEIIACSYDKNIVSAFESRWDELITQ